MFKLIDLKKIESYKKQPVYIYNLENPALSQWAFYCGKRNPLSAWIIFRLYDGSRVAYNTENYRQKWKLFRYKILEKTIEHAPTIEAEFVRHGWWIPVDSYSAFGGSEEVWRAHGNPTAYHYCSECKEQSRLDEFGHEILSNYCPDCGAKMNANTFVFNK